MTEIMKMTLSFRYEDGYYNAYLVLAERQEVKLGSLAIGAVSQYDELRDQFIELMRETASKCLTDVTGVAPTFGAITIEHSH